MIWECPRVWYGLWKDGELTPTLLDGVHAVYRLRIICDSPVAMTIIVTDEPENELAILWFPFL